MIELVGDEGGAEVPDGLVVANDTDKDVELLDTEDEVDEDDTVLLVTVENT